jgi:hypothetical protein
VWKPEGTSSPDRIAMGGLLEGGDQPQACLCRAGPRLETEKSLKEVTEVLCTRGTGREEESRPLEKTKGIGKERNRGGLMSNLNRNQKNRDQKKNWRWKNWCMPMGGLTASSCLMERASQSQQMIRMPVKSKWVCRQQCWWVQSRSGDGPWSWRLCDAGLHLGLVSQSSKVSVGWKTKVKQSASSAAL